MYLAWLYTKLKSAGKEIPSVCEITEAKVGLSWETASNASKPDLCSML